MPTKGDPRIGILLSQHNYERLKSVCLRLDVSQSKLLSAVVSVMSDAEIRAVVDRYEKLQTLEKSLRSIADANMLEYIRGKSVAELEAMVAAANKP